MPLGGIFNATAASVGNALVGDGTAPPTNNATAPPTNNATAIVNGLDSGNKLNWIGLN